MTDPGMSRAFVMEAMQQLVDDEFAEWERTADGALELRLVTGEVFVIGDAGITPQRRSRDVAPLPSIQHRWWGAA
jgi:hypothetical protein